MTVKGSRGPRQKGVHAQIDLNSICFWDGKKQFEENDPEEWAFVPGHDSAYMASSLGRVVRVAGGRGAKRGRLVTPAPERQSGAETGYLVVGLPWPGQSRKTYYLHRLIASIFKPTEHQWCDVHHRDHDKTNCAAYNLEYQDSLEHRQQAWGEYMRHGGRERRLAYGR